METKSRLDMLPEDVLRFIYQKYFKMYVLPELETSLNTWTELTCREPYDYKWSRELLYVAWLQGACDISYDFYYAQPTYNTIGEIRLSFDETWDSDSRKDLIDILCRGTKLPNIMINRFGHVKIVLQGCEEWWQHSYIKYVESRGVQHISNFLAYRIEKNKAYFVDEWGRRSWHYADYGGKWPGSSSDLIPRNHVDHIPWYHFNK